MKAIISSTYSDTYLFFLPIVTYCWNKLGVETICFVPYQELNAGDPTRDERIKGWYKSGLINKTLLDIGINLRWETFYCPEHKQATYAQCSRLFGAAIPELEKDEILFTSDIDMCVFKIPPYSVEGRMTIFGSDLTPENQYPICYASGSVANWISVMWIEYGGMKADKNEMIIITRDYQQCLDDLLGDIDSISMKGDYWAKDQEHLFDKLLHRKKDLIPRASPGTQFAMNRVDRDDSYWQERMDKNIIDAHLWRPGYTDENFANILELMQFMYPEGNFQWLIDYKNAYLKLL